MPDIPLEPFRLCVFGRHRAVEIGYTSISLFFGKPTHAPTSHVSSGSYANSRPSGIRGHHRLRPQKRVKRQRDGYVEAGHRENDRPRRHHLLLHNLHISPGLRVDTSLRKGERRPSQWIRQVSHPPFISPSSNSSPQSATTSSSQS